MLARASCRGPIKYFNVGIGVSQVCSWACVIVKHTKIDLFVNLTVDILQDIIVDLLINKSKVRSLVGPGLDRKHYVSRGAQ